MTRDEIVKGFVEIEPLNTDQFLRAKETLTRIGIPAKKKDSKPTLWQSVHIFHTKDKYYLVHFKQMFMFDGRATENTMMEDDYERLDAIANLLDRWGIVQCVEEPFKTDLQVKVIPYREKGNWNLLAKYNIGNRRLKKVNDE